MRDRRITDPKKAFEFLVSEDHDYGDYEKYGIEEPGYSNRGFILYNIKALHPSVFYKQEFLTLLIDWKAGNNIYYGWGGLLDLAREAFPQGYLRENPKFIKAVVTKIPRELIDSAYIGLHGSHGARFNKNIPDSFYTLEGCQWLENMYEKRFIERFKSGEDKKSLLEEAAMIKENLNRKRNQIMEKTDVDALKALESVEPKTLAEIYNEKKAMRTAPSDPEQ